MKRERADGEVAASVLDRLMAPASARGRCAATAAVRPLCATLARDLDWLLNAKRWYPEPLDHWAESGASILNYGLPDLSSYSARSAADAEALAGVLELAIRRFEPRLLAHSVRVLPRLAGSENGSELRFRIEAVLDAQPRPLPVAFDTDVDLEARHVRVRSVR